MTSRRGLLAVTARLGAAGLVGTGAGLTVAGLSACDSRTTRAGTTSRGATTPASKSPYIGDSRVVALSAALENLAGVVYGTALGLAARGRLGQIPPAVATFATIARSQHADHRMAWNAILTDSGMPAVMTAALTITPMVRAAVLNSRSVVDVLRVMRSIEQTAAETALQTVGTVTDARVIAAAARIAPVDAMHAAVLAYLLGDYPVPDDVLASELALAPAVLVA